MKDNVVRDGYDKVAATYLANRDRLKTGKYVQQLLKYLPKKSTILDLGCGAGVPVDDILMKAGHELVGIDVSSQQIKLARKNCIGGQYLVGDLVDLRELQGSTAGARVGYDLPGSARHAGLNPPR
jgi:ubiquinone/menaquinone biosynthesis C-methylase UbiE